MSLLPKNEPVDISQTNKTIWIYGVPYSGKTTFASTFPDPLMLNTDGNTKFINTPRILIRDQVKMSGRIREDTLAWDYFKNIVSELEQKQNTYKTLVLDLVEDLYQMCRLYIYNRERITHESDNTFKAWDLVTNEFLNVIGRFLTMDYENIILISHEDKSRDITNKKGEQITEIKPNLRDKVALKLAGMVDAVGRVEIDGNVRSIQLQVKNVEFAGKRIPVDVNKIPLSYDGVIKLYNQIQLGGK